MDVVIDADEWVVLRASELRQRGERAEIRIVVEGGKIVDCYIRRASGLEERRSHSGEQRG